MTSLCSKSIGAIPLILLAALLAIAAWRSSRPWIYDEAANVSWGTGGTRHAVTFHVTDADGNPVPCVHVDTQSNSGWSGGGTTDRHGVASYFPGENEILAIELERTTVMECRTILSELFAPTVGDGLRIQVHIKDPAKIEAISP